MKKIYAIRSYKMDDNHKSEIDRLPEEIPIFLEGMKEYYTIKYLNCGARMPKEFKCFFKKEKDRYGINQPILTYRIWDHVAILRNKKDKKYNILLLQPYAFNSDEILKLIDICKNNNLYFHVEENSLYYPGRTIGIWITTFPTTYNTNYGD